MRCNLDIDDFVPNWLLQKCIFMPIFFNFFSKIKSKNEAGGSNNRKIEIEKQSELNETALNEERIKISKLLMKNKKNRIKTK